MGAFLKISKSFVNNKTYLFAIVIICISSFLLVSAFLLFSDYTTSYTDAQNRELYGSYDINIENIDKAQINTLKKKFSVENISEYSIEFSQKETGTTFYIYPDDKFLSMYSLTLTDGKMPQSDKEILCEPWLLYNNGISADNMLGAEITLDGTKYTVSGLIVKNSILEDTSHNAYVICYNNRQPNCILIDVENNVETVYKELSNKYKHSSEIFVSKNIDIELLNENKSFLSDGIILLLIIIVVFSSAVSVWNCVNVFIQKNVKNISIYNLLGIRKFKVLISMSAIIFVCILIANILACLIFALFSKTMISFLNELNFDTLLSFSYSVPIIKYILLSFILTIIESISLLVSVYKVNNMDSYSASINYHLIESKKPSSKPLQYVFWRIASNNFRLSRKRNIFASVSVILSAVTIISVWYMLDNINAENVNYGDISFVVEFSANDIITNDTIKEKTYEKLRANYITETRNICASQIRIPTHNLTDDFKNLLSTSPDYYAAFNNKLSFLLTS